LRDKMLITWHISSSNIHMYTIVSIYMPT